jgi:dephospho-CoA kinase
VTGPAGSGKSQVCKRLAFHGVPVISCDVLARQVVGLLPLQMSQEEKKARAHVVLENQGDVQNMDHMVGLFYFNLRNAFA